MRTTGALTGSLESEHWPLSQFVTSSPGAARIVLGRERLHLAIQVGLALEADAGQVGQRDVAVLDLHAVGEAAEGLEQVGVATRCRPGRGRRRCSATSGGRRAGCSGWPTSRAPSACRACAGTRPGRSSARSRTAASRGPGACRRSGSGCARPASRTGPRRSPSGSCSSCAASACSSKSSGSPGSSYQNRSYCDSALA